MSQNLIALDLGADAVAAIDQALATLEAHLGRLPILDGETVRRLVKMGDKTEAFCRQAAVVLEDNPRLVPPDFSVAALRQLLRRAAQRRPPARDRRLRLGRRGAPGPAAGGQHETAAPRQGPAGPRAGGPGARLRGARRRA